MRRFLGKRKSIILLVALGLLLFSLPKVWAAAENEQPLAVSEQRLVTIFDRGDKQVVLTNKSKVQDVLIEANIDLLAQDAVEPGLETEINSNEFNINIYRARPVVIIDGSRRISTMSPHRSPEQIARGAGLTIFPEDQVSSQVNFMSTGEHVGLEYVIKRAKLVNFIYYGKLTQIRTQKQTVQEFLTDKDVKLAPDDYLNVSPGDEIVDDMTLELWREGKQEIVEEKDVPFSVRRIYDHNQPVAYRKVETLGVLGKRMVTYEVEIKNGEEVSRREINSVTTLEPIEQVEVVGAKSTGGLSKSKGVNVFVDNNGVAHRETYYDLPMGAVMQNCQQGGYYTVRGDGAKVDRDGYVIVAAHLGNYPRCSVVETSLGLGRVYDTGGFTARHPHGFDLATDWTNNDGR